MSFIPARQGHLVSAAAAPVSPAPTETPAAPAPEQPAEPRARIVAALRQRGEGGESDAVPLHHPADGPAVPSERLRLPRAGEDPLAPNLPAMIEDLPGDETRAPQTQFTLDLRIAFLEALAVSGSVRSAARRVKVSHQSVYRARRSSAAFGRAWDAAMVIARGQAEALLADYAIAGVEEEVWYHGEVVGTRRRVSDRLLLAHLGRLDRMRTDTRIEALAEDFDGLLDRMRAGEPIDAPVEGEKEKKEEKEAPEISSPGQCNMRSMSPSAAAPADPPEAPPAAPADPFEGIRFTQPVRRRSKCCGGDMRWPECYNCPDYLVLQWIRGDMAEVRPYGAPPLAALGDPAKVEECQIAAFQAGEGEWWLIGEDFQAWESDGAGGWRPAP